MTDKTDPFEGLRRALEVFDADPVKGDMARESFGEECDPDIIRALLAERGALNSTLIDARRFCRRARMDRSMAGLDSCEEDELLERIDKLTGSKSIDAARSAEGK